MGDPAFVYTTFIRTTGQRLWQALTGPAFTARYWGATFETDWQPGSTMTWLERGSRTADPEQVVLVAEPHRRLSYTWHTPSPEWAAGVGVDEATRATLAAEPRSTVTFELEPLGEVVKLTVVHDGFPAESLLRRMCSQGWPHLLSGLKTLLETGQPLPAPQSEPA